MTSTGVSPKLENREQNKEETNPTSLFKFTTQEEEKSPHGSSLGYTVV